MAALEGYQSALARLLDMLAEEGATIVFMPLNYPHDLKESKKVAGMMEHKALIIEKYLTSQQFIALISYFSISYRYASAFADLRSHPRSSVCRNIL
jgi:ABC-type cobalamin transport system ATPase subunit